MGWKINRDRKVLKDTQEEWFPCFPNDQVEVSLHDISSPADGQFTQWRVSVWGNDDHGLCRDFGNDEWAAIQIYEKIVSQQYVNHDFLYELGLESF